MYVLKGKTKICTPLSSQTDEPGNTKNGTDILCPYVTPSAKFGDGRVPGAGALQPPFHVDFGFFSFFFPVSLTSLQPKPLNRFSWLIAQKT